MQIIKTKLYCSGLWWLSGSNNFTQESVVHVLCEFNDNICMLCFDSPLCLGFVWFRGKNPFSLSGRYKQHTFHQVILTGKLAAVNPPSYSFRFSLLIKLQWRETNFSQTKSPFRVVPVAASLDFFFEWAGRYSLCAVAIVGEYNAAMAHSQIKGFKNSIKEFIETGVNTMSFVSSQVKAASFCIHTAAAYFIEQSFFLFFWPWMHVLSPH